MWQLCRLPAFSNDPPPPTPHTPNPPHTPPPIRPKPPSLHKRRWIVWGPVETSNQKDLLNYKSALSQSTNLSIEFNLRQYQLRQLRLHSGPQFWTRSQKDFLATWGKWFPCARPRGVRLSEFGLPHGVYFIVLQGSHSKARHRCHFSWLFPEVQMDDNVRS